MSNGAQYSPGYSSYLLKKESGEEAEELGAAAEKSGLAGSFGGFLGSFLLPMALGAVFPGLGAAMKASPAVRALAVGGGSLVGSGLGRQFLTSKETKQQLRGTGGHMFWGDERGELKRELFGSQVTSAITSGVTAGLADELNILKDEKLSSLTQEEGQKLAGQALESDPGVFDVGNIIEYQETRPIDYIKNLSREEVITAPTFRPGWEEEAAGVRTGPTSSLSNPLEDLMSERQYRMFRSFEDDV